MPDEPGSPVNIGFDLEQIARKGYISFFASLDMCKGYINSPIKTDDGKHHFCRNS